MNSSINIGSGVLSTRNMSKSNAPAHERKSGEQQIIDPTLPSLSPDQKSDIITLGVVGSIPFAGLALHTEIDTAQGYPKSVRVSSAIGALANMAAVTAIAGTAVGLFSGITFAGGMMGLSGFAAAYAIRNIYKHDNKPPMSPAHERRSGQQIESSGEQGTTGLTLHIDRANPSKSSMAVIAGEEWALVDGLSRVGYDVSGNQVAEVLGPDNLNLRETTHLPTPSRL